MFITVLYLNNYKKSVVHLGSIEVRKNIVCRMLPEPPSGMRNIVEIAMGDEGSRKEGNGVRIFYFCCGSKGFSQLNVKVYY